MRFAIAEGHVGAAAPQDVRTLKIILWERRWTDREAAASGRTRKARGWKASVFRRRLEGFQILLTRKLGGRHYRTRPLLCRVSDFFDVEIEGVPL
jgi:hypothetical protein